MPIITEADLAPEGTAPVAVPASAVPGLHQVSEADLAPLPPQVSGLEAAARGGIQGISLGFSDEISGAIQSLLDPNKTYIQARDESRQANLSAKTAHPWLYGAGELTGSIGTAFVPGLNVAKGASLGKTVANLAAQGAVSGLGSSDASLVGPNQDILGAVKDTAIGGAIGGTIGAAAHGISSLVSKAPEAAAASRLSDVAQGEGLKGSSTVTAKKLLAKDPEAVDAALTAKFKSELVNGKETSLAEHMRGEAKEVLPLVEERLDQVGAKLDPLYKAFDAKEGGLSLHSFINHIDQETAWLAKTPLNEKYIEALDDIKSSALKAWAPDMAEKLAANKTASKTGLLSGDVFKDIPDVAVPFQDFRAMVTRLQKRGSNVINPLNPGEASQLKADVAQNLKEFLNADLERLAESHPDLANHAKQVQEINREYSALSNIHKAVEQRGWKEATGSHSAGGHLAKAVGAGVGATVGHLLPIPGVGHALGAVAGAAAAGSVVKGANAAKSAALTVLESANAKLRSLKEAANAGNAQAKRLLDIIHNSPEVAARFMALHKSSQG